MLFPLRNSLSRYPKNGSFGFMKNKKHISKHNIPPIYPRDQAIPDIFPILFSFETFFWQARSELFGML